MAKEMYKYCECGKEFITKRNTAKYCSHTCREKAYLVRRGESDQEAIKNAQQAAKDEQVRFNNNILAASKEEKEEKIAKKLFESKMEEKKDFDVKRLREITRRNIEAKRKSDSFGFFYGIFNIVGARIASKAQSNKMLQPITKDESAADIDESLPIQNSSRLFRSPIDPDKNLPQSDI